jgi:tetratricopeptide (TPR) repeat protein
MVAVLVALAVLFAGTTALSRWYHRERSRRARAHITTGRAYADAGRRVLAVEEYRAALLLERGDFEAERALALTLLELGQLPEAAAYLTDLLQREPASGPLNLGMARVQSARGAAAEARRWYQRAIYGEWPDEPSVGRITARFELADYLLSHGAREEVLAELLRLKAELSADDLPSQLRLATLLLRAETPDVAADVLMTAAEGHPDAAEVLSALADAQSQAGRSSEARRTLRRLLTLEPARGDVRERLLLVDRVLTLDPTLPNLRITTRIQRAHELLRTVVEETAPCTSAGGDAAVLRQQADARLRRGIGSTSDVAEEDLARSVQLWISAAGCHGAGREAEALSRVIQRVQRSLEDPQP